MKISKIYENKGEKYFREIEETMTLKSLKEKKTVIALGGGAFLNSKIKKEVLDNHISFWLNWDNKTLIKRIKSSIKRPIAYKSSRIEIEELIKNDLLFILKLCIKLTAKILQKKIVRK